ncbi:alpha/beta hydrolase [Latilactobacillus sakei]|uniref:alpha/beta hydrolase n=1 Tax=Latilactobacillus sakei TaxID=1599 RepID=UPI000A3D916C
MKKWGFLLSGGFLLVIILSILLINQRSNQARQQANRVRDSAPTFYLHGYGGSGRSSDSMIEAAEERGRATKVLTAIVSRTGQVALEGHWTDSTTRPIIQVIYKNNRNPNYRQNGEWFKRVLIAVNRQHHFKQFNVVAHSMGNLTLAFYLANNAQNKKMPQLAKFVSIAGHYAGIIGMDDRANQNHLAKDGRPQQINATYRQLMGLRHRLPKIRFNS